MNPKHHGTNSVFGRCLVEYIQYKDTNIKSRDMLSYIMYYSISEYCDFSLAFSSGFTHMHHIHFRWDAALLDSSLSLGTEP